MVVSAVANVVLAATSAEVPEWLKWVGGVVVTTIVVPTMALLLRALAKRLGVPEDTTGGTHRATEDRGTPATRDGPEQSGQEAPAERYDAKMAMLERAFERQDERIEQLSALLAVVSAENSRLKWEYEQATGRPVPGPPPGSIPPPRPPGNPSPGSSLGS